MKHLALSKYIFPVGDAKTLAEKIELVLKENNFAQMAKLNFEKSKNYDGDKLNVYRYEDNLVFIPEQDGDIAVSRKGCCIQLYSRKLVNFILDVSDGERKFNPVVKDNCVYININSHNK